MVESLGSQIERIERNINGLCDLPPNEQRVLTDAVDALRNLIRPPKATHQDELPFDESEEQVVESIGVTLTRLALSNGWPTDRQSILDAQSIIESHFRGGDCEAAQLFAKQCGWTLLRKKQALRLAAAYRSNQSNDVGISASSATTDGTAAVSPVNEQIVAPDTESNIVNDHKSEPEQTAEAVTTDTQNPTPESKTTGTINPATHRPEPLNSTTTATVPAVEKDASKFEAKDGSILSERERTIDRFKAATNINLQLILGQKERAQRPGNEHMRLIKQIKTFIGYEFDELNKLGSFIDAGCTPQEIHRLGQVLGFRVETNKKQERQLRRLTTLRSFGKTITIIKKYKSRECADIAEAAVYSGLNRLAEYYNNSVDAKS